jgi:uncharacterized protein
MAWDDWHDLSAKLAKTGVNFHIKPNIRIKGRAGQQATMLIMDPGDKALEFKSFRNDANLFSIDNE